MTSTHAASRKSTHTLQCRVYYEDTDAGGVVYHARYLAFAERGRTEWLRSMGTNQQQLLADYNLVFVVKRAAIEYHAPARLDDLLEITTELTHCGAATLDIRQILRHEGTLLAEVMVTVVTVSPEGKVLRLPKELREKLR